MMKKRNKWLLRFGMFILLIITFSILFILGNEYTRYTSPDKRYTIVVYRLPMLIAFPGQASDAPGIIVLYNAWHLPIRVTDLDMLQMLSPPEWNENEVYMPLIFTWKL